MQKLAAGLADGGLDSTVRVRQTGAPTRKESIMYKNLVSAAALIAITPVAIAAVGCDEKFSDACPTGSEVSGHDCVKVVHDDAGVGDGGAGAAGIAGHAGATGTAGGKAAGGSGGVGGAQTAGSGGIAAAGKSGSQEAGAAGTTGSSGSAGAGNGGKGGGGGTGVGGVAGAAGAPAKGGMGGSAIGTGGAGAAGKGGSSGIGGGLAGGTGGGPGACSDASQCPDTGSECVTRTCNGTCGTTFPDSGTALVAQTVGDCKTAVCDGVGGTTTATDPNDAPGPQGECWVGGCSGSTATQTPKNPGDACSGSVCDGAGNCGVCSPGKTRCTANAFETCDMSGQWTSTEACEPLGKLCSSLGCSAIATMRVGRGHACVSLNNGVTKCWGDNSLGQLGPDATGDHSDVAIEIPSVSGYVSTNGSANHSCVTNFSSVACWGSNEYGQLGSGPVGNGVFSAAAVTVSIGPTSVVEPGGLHTCAQSGAQLYCWGDNTYGELGVGDNAPHTGPTAVPGVNPQGSTFATGFAHTCSGTMCWGYNAFGQVGVGDVAPYNTPQPLSKTFSVMSLDNQSCGISGGSLFCWGSDSAGQVGDAIVANEVTTPTSTGLTNITGVGAGYLSTCAVKSDFSVYCWGDNSSGQLGVAPTSGISPTPHVIPGAAFGQVGVGADFACGRAMSGNGVHCWGSNLSGQLGKAATGMPLSPTPIKIVW